MDNTGIVNMSVLMQKLWLWELLIMTDGNFVILSDMECNDLTTFL